MTYPSLVYTELSKSEWIELSPNTTSAAIHSILVWAITDKNPPVKSGVSTSKQELIDIAKANNIDGFAEWQYLESFSDCVRSRDPIISAIRIQTGLYSFAAWKNYLHYLCDADPIAIIENIDYHEVSRLITEHGGENSGGMSYQPGFIRGYIRKREAKRKISRKSQAETPVFTEFVYSPENTWHIPRCRWVWQRHRVVKKTEKTIFIEEHPYHGSLYLKRGWQAFIVYTIMIDRGFFEKNHEFHHITRNRTYFDKVGAPELGNRHFIGYDEWGKDYDTDDVIEIPSNGIQWALTALNLSDVPITKEELKKSFNKLSIRYHPDKGGCTKKMQMILRAKNFLIAELRLD